MASRVDSDFLELQTALAGEYSLERELGRGGMGVVYLAREVQLNRLVAIKVLPSADPELRDRFLREARMAASLSHPNIVAIHRVGEAGRFVYFAMAYVDGETLGERLRARGPLSPAAATRTLREVAWALAYAHGRGVIHRDVKPDNILIERATGRALVMDFGIALAGDDESSEGRVMGTAQFMSPEQATGGIVDGRSDLYSLGIVGYLVLSGRLPFDAENLPALLGKQVNEPAPSLARAVPGLPRPLSAAIDRCLRKDASERFATGEAMADALDESPANRAQLPAPLRLWLRAADPLKPLYLMWSTIFFMGTLSEMRRGGDWPVTIAFMLLPAIPSFTFHARKLRKVLGAGYTLPDVQHAVKIWQGEKREELAFERDGEMSRGLQILRASTIGLAALFGLLATGIIDPRTIVRWLPIAKPAGLLVTAVVAIPAMLAVVSAIASHALGVPFLPRELRRGLTGAVRTWFWNSRAGGLITRMLTPKRRDRLVSLEYRPTEMALGLAVGDLFDALPKSYRLHLAELPEVVRRLEAHAAASRVQVEHLESLDPAGDGALSEQLTRARASLAQAVAALESIRLDLLRLHGGETDLRPITSVLEASQQVGAEVARLTNARGEVEKLAPAKPIPTPA